MRSTSYYTGYVFQILSLFLEIIGVINFHADTVQAVTKLPFLCQVIFTPYTFWLIIRGTFFVVLYSLCVYL